MVCATITAKDITNANSGFVYEAMLDEIEESMQDLHEYDSIAVKSPVNWPSVVQPFGYTPDYFSSMANACNPAEGIELVSIPYSNVKGDVLLSYDLFMPAAHHDLKPTLPITYNSSRGKGNLGIGWSLDIPQIEIDTIQNNHSIGGHPSYVFEGKRLVYFSYENDSLAIFRYEVNSKDEEFHRITKNGLFRWELKDGNGNTFHFGAFDEDGNLTHVTKGNISLRTFAWKLCKIENSHGDYVDYRYGEKVNSNDSIFVGNPLQKPHTCIVLNGILSQKNWEEDAINIKKYKSITYLHRQERKGAEWDMFHQYNFTYDLDTLKRIHSVGYDLSNNTSKIYFHSFEYYNDRDSVVKHKQFRNDYHNISLDSLIIDRTGLLKSVHNPLGGCFTIDYAYSGVPDTLGPLPPRKDRTFSQSPLLDSCITSVALKINDSIVADSAFKSKMLSYMKVLLDSLFQRKMEISAIPFDTLVQRYFDYTDNYKGKRVMASLWVNDGVSYDGFPSLSRFDYSRPLCDSTGIFLGFSKIVTHYIDTRSNQCMRQKVKKYDTTNVASIGNIKKIEIIEGGNMLKSIEYDWHDNKLSAKRIHIGDYSYSFSYRYDSGRLAQIKYGSDETVNYSYAKKKDNQVLLNSITFDDNKSNWHNRLEFEYSAEKPYNLIKVVEGQNITSFKYDKDGNITEIRFPKDGNGDSAICTYLYDRRFNMFLERIENNLGYRTEMEDYNYPYGKPGSIIDRNGYVTKLTYDGFGRIDTIIAPNEQDNDIPFSATFSYADSPKRIIDEEREVKFLAIDSIQLHIPQSIMDGVIPDSVKNKIVQSLNIKGRSNIEAEIIYDPAKDSVVCSNVSFDPNDSICIVSYDTVRIQSCQCGDQFSPYYTITKRYNAPYNSLITNDSIIEVYNYVDGFGREMQSTHKMDITDVDVARTTSKVNSSVWVTSDAKSYDPWGRLSACYPPAINSNRGVNSAIYSTATDSAYQYDALDRLTSLVTPLYNFSYKYSTSANEFTLCHVLNSTVEDTLDIISYNHKNQILSKEIKCTNSRKSGSDILVFIDRERYTYDLMGKVASEKTPYDEVYYTYNSLGQLIKENSAIHGIVNYRYDIAGNLIQKIKADGDTIEYTYSHNLLTKITYSKHPEQNTSFSYGDKNASFNRVGRLSAMIDETGVQEFYYGRHGETAKVRRTLVIPNRGIETYTTQFKYDTWYKLSEVIYPDGEMVKYRYDVAGLLSRVWGEKYHIYNYVDHIGYDMKKNRVHYEYCNGNETFKSINNGEYHSNVKDKRNATVLLGLKSSHELDYSTDSIAYPNLVLNKTLFLNYNQKERRESLSAEWYSPDTSLSLEHYLSYEDSARLYNERLASIQKNAVVSGDASMEIQYRYNYIHPYLPNYKQEPRNGEDKYLNTHFYTYDKNGNMIEDRELSVFSDMVTPIPLGAISSRSYSYNSMDKVATECDNGYIKTFWYDGLGRLTFKLSGEQSSISVNGVTAYETANIKQIDFLINPYFERIGDSTWIKHIRIEDSPWVSKIEDNASYGADARRIERAFSPIPYQDLWRNAYENLYKRFKMHEAECKDSMPYPATSMLRNANVDMGKDIYESSQYYYHYDRNGNIILVTDLEGAVYQLPIFLNNGELIYNNKEGDFDFTERDSYNNSNK